MKTHGRGSRPGPVGGLAGLVTLCAALLIALVLAACSSAAPHAAAAGPAPTGSAPSGVAASTPPAPTATPAPDGPTSSPSAAGATAGADPSGSASASAQATPVFVDEPCDPSAGRGSQSAINGLDLYCVSNSAGSVWSTSPPPSPTPPPTRAGGACSRSQDGSYIKGADGRPLECLRDLDGRYRWTDVS